MKPDLAETMLRKSTAEAARRMDAAVAEALSKPPPKNPFVNPSNGPPLVTYLLMPVFRVVDDEWIPTGQHRMEYRNPARTAWEHDKARGEEAIRALCHQREPRAICKTLYQIEAAIPGIPKGSFVCGACEEVWPAGQLVAACEHEADGICAAVAVQYRRPLAQIFYAWCKDNGFTKQPEAA